MFIPKCRKNTIFGQIRKDLGDLMHEPAGQKGCRIVEGHLMADHVHMLIEIPPKYAVARIVGFMKGKHRVPVCHRG